ncbi:PDZ domain-containing protein [Deinococcus radiopugnans]|uniref:PDZ domain-containing protein n=1 Tax=Deinococcus radiopugnans ATCC 19172 TaxID=585398 RepID=A0A5C4YA99_9DEIO|nr:PDZ domain-containing protein [Deinococcus radiopugnans]MBB6017460.1 hypothetical protein [Deinococcus radiopugnans ATCC 19172]TNM71986.1 PDZ domain-containing protein [Deinococcus radiopugnans ATCC 19172]
MKKVLLGSVAAALTACAPATSTNFAPAALEQAPSINVQVGLAPTMPKLKTFTVIPLVQITDQAQATGITAQHLAFQARNYMEMLGYSFVNKVEDADLSVLVDASSRYSETYVPPTQYTAPAYVPGTTATYNSNSGGSFNYGGASSGWGTYTGRTSGTVTVPGYYTSRTYVAPGYTRGYHYPAITVLIYDVKTQQQQVSASAVGTSQNPDVRVSMQNLMYETFAKMPLANDPQNVIKSGRIGVSFAPWTADGNNYYPIITAVDKDQPAARAGIVSGDFILSIDGQPTLNKPIADLDVMIAGEANQERTLVINRGTETRTVKLRMVQR